MAIGPRQLEKRRLRYATETAEMLEKAFSKRAELQLSVIEALWRLASDERVHERVRLSALALLLVKEESEAGGASVEVNINATEPSPVRVLLAERIRAVLGSGAASESVVDAVPEPAAVVEPVPAVVPANVRPLFASTTRPADEAPPVLGLPEDV